MKVNPRRIAAKLAAWGFEPFFFSKISKEFEYVRATSIKDLFEQIWVIAQGKKGEAVYANLAVSVVKGRATKGLVEIDLLMEMAGVPDRGWTIISSIDEAKLWEKQLAEVAPSRASKLAEEKGPELLERTASARNSVDRYFHFLEEHAGDLDELEEWMMRKASSSTMKRSEQLAEWPGVLQVSGWDQVYRIATLAIVSFAHEVEAQADELVSADPLENPELMWRIQILADRLKRIDFGTLSNAINLGNGTSS